MVRNHRKPLKAMVATSKTIVKPLMAMVRPPKKHSMVMVSSKTIENMQWSLQNHWNLQWFLKNYWTCQWSSQINILLKQLNYPVVTFTILIWLCCSKVYCQLSLIFIAAHCSYKPNLPHPTFCMLIYCTLVSFWIIYLDRSSVYDITFSVINIRRCKHRSREPELKTHLPWRSWHFETWK